MANVDIRREIPEAAPSGTHANVDREGLGDAAEALYAAREAYELQAAMDRPSPPTGGDRRGERRKSLARALWRSAGIEEELLAYTTDRKKLFADGTLGDLFHPGPDFVGVHPTPPVDAGVLWWDETSWWTPGLIGLVAYFDDAAGGVRHVGQLSYDDGDLWWGNAGALARFALGTDRMPPRGRYVSRPTTDLFGSVLGWTGWEGPFAGDNWSKCWLHTTQTLRTSSGAIVAQAHEARELLFIEDDLTVRAMPLPGSLLFPPVAFDLDPTQPLIAELELKFDIQLEGESKFRFGNNDGVMPTLFRTPQWTLAPA